MNNFKKILKVVGYILFFLIIAVCCGKNNFIADYFSIKQQINASEKINNTKELNTWYEYEDKWLRTKLPNKFEKTESNSANLKDTTIFSISLENGVFSRISNLNYSSPNSRSEKDILSTVIENEVKSNNGDKLIFEYSISDSVGQIEGSYSETEGRFKGQKVSFNGFLKKEDETKVLMLFHYALGENENTIKNLKTLVQSVQFK